MIIRNFDLLLLGKVKIMIFSIKLFRWYKEWRILLESFSLFHIAKRKYWEMGYWVDGDDGIKTGSCVARGGSRVLSDTSRGLIVENYFPTNPNPLTACKDNSDGLFNMLSTCYVASGNRWSNYIAVDFYKVRSSPIINLCCRFNINTSKPSVNEVLVFYNINEENFVRCVLCVSLSNIQFHLLFWKVTLIYTTHLRWII